MKSIKHLFLQSMEEEEKIEWDLEELKQAYIRNAEEYDKLMKKEEEDE